MMLLFVYIAIDIHKYTCKSNDVASVLQCCIVLSYIIIVIAMHIAYSTCTRVMVAQTSNVLCSFAGDLEGSELKGGLVAHDHHTQLLRQPTLFQSLHHTHHV